MLKRKKAGKSPDAQQESEETFEIKIPKYLLKVYKTENEQKMYMMLLKTCDLCMRLKFDKTADFHKRVLEWPKDYAKLTLHTYRNKNVTFWSKHQTAEDRIRSLSGAINRILNGLCINDIQAKEILEDYDGFNEKLDKKIKEYTKDDTSRSTPSNRDSLESRSSCGAVRGDLDSTGVDHV
jgi:hypothetical protein